jgi:hypothetical protein
VTLTDPRGALADQSNFIGCLVGLAGAARLVRALADDPLRRETTGAADDFVHVLLGLASLGRAIEHLAAPVATPTETAPAFATQVRWLR